jgi:protein TonB
MSALLDNREHLEQELKQEPLAAPAAGSLLLHAGLFGAVLAWGMVGGLFHHSQWGSAGGGGAIQVNLVSSALPLPNDQPQNDNVLATETPSKAPATPDTKTRQAVDETAIAIQGKQKSKPQPVTSQRSTAKPQQQKFDNRAQYGEQTGSNTARSTRPDAGFGPVNITNGDFGSRFAWYVEVIKRKVDQNWYRQQVDPRTPHGAKVQLYFRVSRQGGPSGVKINQSSGSPTLDRSCLLAAQRVDSFGPLPAESRDLWLDVTYDCTY